MANLFILLLAVAAIAGGHFLEGGNLQALYNLPALVIVFGGTFAASILQSEARSLWLCFSLIPHVFSGNRQPYIETRDKIMDWSRMSRAQGFLSLEKESIEEDDLFLKRGLEMVIDGLSASSIRDNLEIELLKSDENGASAADVMESMGGYAPTLGIIGAVLGLIQVMSNMEQTELLGAGIATAFVATIYGVASANLLFLPLSFRMKSLVRDRGNYMEMQITGLEGLANGDNPRVIEQRLIGYTV